MEVYKGLYSFYIGSDEKPLACLKYRLMYNTMFIDSIEISSQLKGQGIAADLTERALSFAKERGYHIEPCSIISK